MLLMTASFIVKVNQIQLKLLSTALEGKLCIAMINGNPEVYHYIYIYIYILYAKRLYVIFSLQLSKITFFFV